MTQNTVSNAVAARDTAAMNLINHYSSSFAQVLPSHVKAETFVRLSQGLLRRNKDLREAAEANPNSFLAALLECARLGHEPGTDQYALVPFKEKGGLVIVGMEQYQGEIERMYRAGAVTSVRCEVVRRNDTFRWAPTQMRLPQHDYDALSSDEDRGDLRGVYAYAEMVGGALSQVVVMPRSEVMKHRAVARTLTFWDGPWQPSMWKKTAVHELEKWVPTSAEYRREQLRAVAQAQAAAPSPTYVDRTTGEVLDGELVDDKATGWPPVAQPGSGATPPTAPHERVLRPVPQRRRP